MISIEQIVKGHKTAESRWARFGPYYAMFPLEFAFDVVDKYSNTGDYIIDPFAGRGSSIFASSIRGRNALGIEINPVGWLYGYVKLSPSPKTEVLCRLQEIYNNRNQYETEIKDMHEFFRLCFCDEVLKFLLSARDHLDWRNTDIDKTLMAIILIHLHGKLGEGLSNQMKMTKAMGMNYSIQWWKAHNLATPPEINPYHFINKRIVWRYEKGVISKTGNCKMILGDSVEHIPSISRYNKHKYSLLFTSPPYCSITDYHADQWLRLWLLGRVASPISSKEKHKGRFANRQEYRNLLESVFSSCVIMMKENSTVYVRTDSRQYTFETTCDVLKRYFPDYKMKITDRPVTKRTQTDVLGNTSSKKGEIDIVLTRGTMKLH
ncbi:DNA modification methylase [Campylobacterota bacterium]|nr:DNA modification methylase [Campylobacterota bacterium]